MRNALIYGTLCRTGIAVNIPTARGSSGKGNERLLGAESETKKGIVTPAKPRGLLVAEPDAKPSVWEIYYGAGVVDGDVRMKSKATDAPYYVSDFFFKY